MKITFVMGVAEMSGGSRVIATHARLLKERGHEVRIVSVPPRQPNAREISLSLVHGWGWPRRHRIGISHVDRVGVGHHRLSKRRPVVDADIPDGDVVVATWWETAEWVAGLSPRKGAKAYFIQGYEIWGGDPSRVNATWRLPLHKIVISSWLKNIARDQFEDTEVSLVPNSVDLEQFSVPPRNRQAVPTVGTLYHTASLKACDMVFRAVLRAKSEEPGLQLVSFGQAPAAPDLPLPAGARYTVNPPQLEIKDVSTQGAMYGYAEAEPKAFASRRWEAMACRCPVISTKVGGPVDFIRAGQNGFLVEIDDEEGLADRLIQVLKLSDAQWHEMSDSAYATACRYTWQDASKLMEQALADTVARGRLPLAG